MSDAIDQFLNKNTERVEKCKRIIKEMLNDETSYGYAEDTLFGILHFVEENNSVSDAQIQAVVNIRNKPSNPYGKRRRY